MAKDDYHVIVYKILSYLYTALKAGERVDDSLLKPDSRYLQSVLKLSKNKCRAAKTSPTHPGLSGRTWDAANMN